MTTTRLGGFLIEPVAEYLNPDLPLVIFAGPRLSGIPFSLLPWDKENDLLIDRFEITYVADPNPGLEVFVAKPSVPLIVGFDGPRESDELSMLSGAEREAKTIASLYLDAELLTGDQASASALRTALGQGYDLFHFAGHFQADTASPLDSRFVLQADPGLEAEPEDQSFTLGSLLSLGPTSSRILYLSGCDTGRGLPSAPHGFDSLAQAISNATFGATVLSLWPLDDEGAEQLAVEFHRRLISTGNVAGSLREAQLSLRDDHPSLWAALVAYR